MPKFRTIHKTTKDTRRLFLCQRIEWLMNLIIIKGQANLEFKDWYLTHETRPTNNYVFLNKFLDYTCWQLMILIDC